MMAAFCWQESMPEPRKRRRALRQPISHPWHPSFDVPDFSPPVGGHHLTDSGLIFTTGRRVTRPRRIIGKHSDGGTKGNQYHLA